MKIKVSKLYTIWFLCTIVLVCAFCFGKIQIDAANSQIDVQECQIETQIVGLPNISVIEKEVITTVDKEEVVYNFPFETKDMGIVEIKGICSCCVPSKVYGNMRGVEGVTVFANSKYLAEGTLLWIENVGIRQVQPVLSDFEGIFVYYDSHVDAELLGNQKVQVFQIQE